MSCDVVLFRRMRFDPVDTARPMHTLRHRAPRHVCAQVCYMPSTADTYVIAFQRWLDRFGGGGPFGAADAGFVEALGPRQSRTELLDR
jgi:hypothetical protein